MKLRTFDHRNQMGTELLYLSHPALLRTKAEVVDVGFDEAGSYCVLNQTLFCPQGGGQASDIGFLWDGEGNRFPIHKVLWVDDEVRHYGPLKTAVLNGKDRIVLHIDTEKRTTNAKGHTAGHLVHVVVEEIAPNLKATKGSHFSKNAYIRFLGLPETDTENILKEVNASLVRHIASRLPVTSEIVEMSEMEKKASFPFEIPKDKPFRLVRIGDYPPVPCGGTHLSHLGELNGVAVDKIKRKKGNTVCSYRFH